MLNVNKYYIVFFFNSLNFCKLFKIFLVLEPVSSNPFKLKFKKYKKNY